VKSPRRPVRRTRQVLCSSAVLACALVVAAGCGGDSGSDGDAKAGEKTAKEVRLSLVSYSTPREAYEKLIPGFAETDEGAGVEFDESYGASGEQSRAVEGGLPADVVAFSLEPDVKRLVDAGKVAADWNAGETKGMVTESVVVFAVRAGNPKKIEDWDDLLEDDIEVITPNPFTSGGARWNLMAAYGAWTRAGDSHEEALDKLKGLLQNTPVQSKSAREALQVFAAGKGDVMLAYENEALTAKEKGEDLEYVIPDSTILIENPVAITSDSRNAEEAQAFVDYLLSDEAQEIYADAGYRAVSDTVAEEHADDYPTPSGLFTIEDFGGWDKVMTDFFDREKGSVAKIEQELGVPTDG
jgi:sulfate/thiosulfate transport system substrate-binding protein